MQGSIKFKYFNENSRYHAWVIHIGITWLIFFQNNIKRKYFCLICEKKKFQMRKNSLGIYS